MPSADQLPGSGRVALRIKQPRQGHRQPGALVIREAVPPGPGVVDERIELGPPPCEIQVANRLVFKGIAPRAKPLN